jgi:multicomponent Na+:H+ antiporter subunit A
MIASLTVLFAFSLFSLWLAKFRLIRPALAAVPAALLCHLILELQNLPEGQFYFEVLPWNAFPGFHFSFRLDALSVYLSSVVLFIGSCIALYASQYFEAPYKAVRFFSLFFLFMGAMLGVVLSENLLGLFVFWELTSISSYLLIAFYYDQQSSRDSALQAFLVTGVGGLCMLGGILLLGQILGTYEISRLLEISAQMGPTLAEVPGIFWAFILILLGALTKSAQFPFHFWLPNAMTAPTPASSYLHSATMVKAGVFLLLRLFPIFSVLPWWKTILMPVGAATFTVAAFMALFQIDLKKYLAYTTVGALGILTFFIGSGSPEALYAVLLFIPAHALYKAPLFLLVGNIEHATHTRDVRKLHALAPYMKGTFIAVLFCALSMAGLPPFFSFVAKEVMLTELFSLNAIYLLLFVFCASVFVYLAILLVHKVFIEKNPKLKVFKEAHESPLFMVLAPMFLGLTALVFSLVPWLLNYLKLSDVFFYLNPSFTVFPEYLLWHGINKELVTSVIAVGLGVILYKLLKPRIPELFLWGTDKLRWGPNRLYDFKMSHLVGVSGSFFRTFQTGRLNFYLILIVSFAAFLFLFPFGSEIHLTGLKFDLSGVKIFEVLMIFAMIAGALMALKPHSNLSALTSLGIVGFGTAFLFLANGAADVALTQFLVETLTIILLVFTFRYLPKTPLKSEPGYTSFTAIVAIVFGLGIGFNTFLASQDATRDQIRSFFAANSYIQAHGKNVVNVILVDFRGFDTLGEIAVLSLAAIGVFTLIAWKSKRSPKRS